jgi:hypothetical protein
MTGLVQNRWAQLGAASALAVVLGVVIGLVVSAAGSDGGPTAGELYFTTGGPATGGGGSPSGGSTVGTTALEQQLPMSVTDALAAGWTDPVLCAPGRGRFFYKAQDEEADPYFLMYDRRDALIGVYLYSNAEMPSPPWQRLDGLQAGGGLPLLDYEHWGLFVYSQDPTRACTRLSAEGVELASGGSGGLADDLRWRTSAERSTPTPVLPPTPTPTASLVLESAAKQMSSLKSLSFALTTDPEGSPLAEGEDATKAEGTVILPDEVTLQVTGSTGTPQSASADSLPFEFKDLAVTVGGIAGALQDAVDTERKWIDNVPHRGLSGTVPGQQLAALIPSAVSDATVKVSLWLAEDGLIRLVRIEGPVAPDDPSDVVRLLSLSGFNEQE